MAQSLYRQVFSHTRQSSDVLLAGCRPHDKSTWSILERNLAADAGAAAAAAAAVAAANAVDVWSGLRFIIVYSICEDRYVPG